MLVSLFVSFIPHLALAQQAVFPPVTTSEGQHYHVNHVGGIHNIDKVSKIDIWFYRDDDDVIRIGSIQTKYKLMDGNDKTFKDGDWDHSYVGSIDFPDGVYLKRIEAHDSSYHRDVTGMKICRTDGFCTPKWGWGEPNVILEKERSVIKVVAPYAGSVLSGIGAIYETDRIELVQMANVEYNEVMAPYVADDLTFQSPDAVVVLDNLDKDSSTQQSTTVSFSEVITTAETTTVTTTERKDFRFSLGVSVESSFKIFGAGVSASVSTEFEVGTSLEKAFEESSTTEFSTEISREYPVVANPGERVTASIFWREVRYAYNWTGPVNFYYAFDPETPVLSGELSGAMEGSQPFPRAYVRFETETSDSSSTETTPDAGNGLSETINAAIANGESETIEPTPSPYELVTEQGSTASIGHKKIISSSFAHTTVSLFLLPVLW